MLQVNSLTYDCLERPLLRKVQWSLLKGRLLHLQGTNGVGKSTLLRLLAGLLQPLSGSIYWNGQPIVDAMPTFQKKIAYIGHKLGLSLELSIRENYALE